MPGHFKCCVKHCTNTSTYPDDTLSFHRFPKNNTLKQAWISYCGNSEEWAPKDFSRICSDHFSEGDFEINLQESLLGVKSRRMLRKNVIPTKTCWQKSNAVLSSESVSDNLCMTFQEARAVPLDSETCMPNQSPTNNDEDSQSPSTSTIQPCKEHEKIIKQLKLCNKTIVQQLSEERSKIKHLKKTIGKQNLQLSRSILANDLNYKIKEVLSGILSPAQLDLVLKLKKKVRWSKDDLSKALLGKTPGIVHSRANTLPYQEDEITLTNSVLEKAEIDPILPQDDNEEEDEQMDCGTSTSQDCTSLQSSDNCIERDGVEYISGWLARKFSKLYPELGNYTYMLRHEDHSYAKPSWVKQLSYGGLTEPSSKLRRSIEIIGETFQKNQ